MRQCHLRTLKVVDTICVSAGHFASSNKTKRKEISKDAQKFRDITNLKEVKHEK